MGHCGTVIALLAVVLASGAQAEERIYISKAECRLFFSSNGELIKEYPCATGRGMCSPVGQFVIQNKRSNGGWRYSDGSWDYVGGAAIPMLGPLWMGLATSSGRGTNYGIHGNRDASSIGTMASHGCIRMHNHHIDELYAIAPPGTRVRLANYLSDLSDDLAALHAFRVVFAADDDRDYDLYIVGSDGQGRSRLLDLSGDERSPVFSPEGERVAFVRWVGGASHLACVRLEDSEVTEFESIAATECMAWSEQGLMVRTEDGASWAVDVESGALSAAEALETPVVSDDGESVVVASERARERGIPSTVIRPRLPGPAAIESPRLSPDDASLAFSCQVGKQRDLFACHADGSLMRNLTESAANETDPAWSPVPVYAPGITLLDVETAPPGLEIQVRPAGSKNAYPKGKSPAAVPIVSATAGGSEYEVIVSDRRSGRTVSSTVRLRRGERTSVFLDLNAAEEQADDEVEEGTAPEEAEEASPTGSRRRFFDSLRRRVPDL